MRSQLRWGQLVTGFETARLSLAVARRAIDLLTPADRALFLAAVETLGGIEQRAWLAHSREVDGPPRKRSAKK